MPNFFLGSMDFDYSRDNKLEQGVSKFEGGNGQMARLFDIFFLPRPAIMDTDPISYHAEHQPPGKTLSIVIKLQHPLNNIDSEYEECAQYSEGRFDQTFAPSENMPEDQLLVPANLRHAFCMLSKRLLYGWTVLYIAQANGEIHLTVNGYPPDLINTPRDLIAQLIQEFDLWIEEFRSKEVGQSMEGQNNINSCPSEEMLSRLFGVGEDINQAERIVMEIHIRQCETCRVKMRMMEDIMGMKRLLMDNQCPSEKEMMDFMTNRTEGKCTNAAMEMHIRACPTCQQTEFGRLIARGTSSKINKGAEDNLIDACVAYMSQVPEAVDENPAKIKENDTHHLRTDDCPTLSRMRDAVIGRMPWDSKEQKHIDNCAYCQKFIPIIKDEFGEI